MMEKAARKMQSAEAKAGEVGEGGAAAREQVRSTQGFIIRGRREAALRRMSFYWTLRPSRPPLTLTVISLQVEAARHAAEEGMGKGKSK